METQRMTCDEVKALLPHRWPMLMIDKVIALVPGESAVCEKLVSDSDIFMQGHFPGRAIFPGVLLVEAMAQACLIAALAKFPDPANRPLFFLGSSDARFLLPVIPGSRLRIEATIERQVGNLGMGSGRVICDDQLVARSKLSFGSA